MTADGKRRRFGGMTLEHDREWNYELDRIATAIEEQEAETIGLQFPQGLKRQSAGVADDIEAHVDRDITTLISGKPCYGACDVDMQLARRTDLFAHFGHTPMEESDGIIYVPLYSNVDPTPIIDEAIDEFPDPDAADADTDIGLVTTAQHAHRLNEMRERLEMHGYTVHTRRGAERLSQEGQVLGCNYASADLPVEQLLYVGGGRFHPVGLAMEHPDKYVVIADPVNNLVTEADADDFIKQRYGAIHRAMDADTWGVIYCTKIGQGRWELAQELVNNNETAYMITTDEVTPDRLRSFGFDAYVNTGCPRVTTDDGGQFPAPLLTPGEYKIAIGEKPMDSLSFDTFHGTW